jgi:hypothetical protein
MCIYLYQCITIKMFHPCVSLGAARFKNILWGPYMEHNISCCFEDVNFIDDLEVSYSQDKTNS